MIKFVVQIQFTLQTPYRYLIIYIEFHKVECVQKSTFFCHAEKRAEIPFLYHQVLECSYRGLTHTISDHDITIKIPEGAVSEGETVHIEFGVSMYGPFRFPENTRPISPIIWLCLLEEDYELKEMFEISVPHFFMHLTEQRIRDHQVHFAKAHHKHIQVKDKHASYTFHQLDTQPSFIAKNDKHYAILESKHCCFLCLAKHTRNTYKLAMDAGYCLVRIEPSPDEVYFVATFSLSTCLQVR